MRRSRLFLTHGGCATKGRGRTRRTLEANILILTLVIAEEIVAAVLEGNVIPLAVSFSVGTEAGAVDVHGPLALEAGCGCGCSLDASSGLLCGIISRILGRILSGSGCFAAIFIIL